MNATHITSTKSPASDFDITTLKFRPWVAEGNAARGIHLRNNVAPRPRLDIPTERQ